MMLMLVISMNPDFSCDINLQPQIQSLLAEFIKEFEQDLALIFFMGNEQSGDFLFRITFQGQGISK